MKILVIASDKLIMDKSSKVSSRFKEYGELADKYTIVLPFGEDRQEQLADNVAAFGVKGNLKPVQLFRIYRQAKKILKKEKYDLITLPDPYYFSLIGLVLARAFNLAFDIQVHGFEKLTFFRKMIARFNLKRADSVRVVSERLKRILVLEFSVDPDKINVVPIFTEVKSQKSKVKRDDKDEFIFLTAGRLVPVKNIELQIKAFKFLMEDYKDKELELWITGDGALRKDLEILVKNLKLEDRVKFLGWRDDLENIYLAADAFLLTSFSEGWCMAVIEAASFGLPIIMTDVGLAGEVIVNEESGLVIPVNDEEALIAAMKRLIADKDLREKLSLGARQAVLNLPTKEDILKRYREGWERSVERKSSTDL